MVEPLLPVCPWEAVTKFTAHLMVNSIFKLRNMESGGQIFAGPSAFLEEQHIWGNVFRVTSTLLMATFLLSSRPGLFEGWVNLLKNLRLQNVVGTLGLNQIAPGKAFHPKSGSTVL